VPQRLITLTTDFGLRDHFVAAMKGVILGIEPRARIIDITHEIDPFQITEAAFVVAQVYPFYPRRTVHVAVVDPGVGSERRPILIETAGQFFVGPDNGVFGLVCRQEKSKVRHISNRKYFLENVSNTFHGRDIFAPVAAYLSAGLRPSAFGPAIRDFLVPACAGPEQTGERSWRGTVLKVDRFGNLITNFRADEFAALAARPFRLRIGKRTVKRLAATFSDVAPGMIAVVAGSAGYLEVVANQESVAEKLNSGPGSSVRLILL